MPKNKNKAKTRKGLMRKGEEMRADYLLNFRYQTPEHPSRMMYSSNRKTRALFSNKDHFLRSNFRFLVPSVEFVHKEYFTTPEYPIVWEEVAVVVGSTFDLELEKCPICLDMLCAPRIIRCGHIFCWSCIARYIHDKKSMPCPLCTETMRENDLRVLQLDVYRRIQVDQTVVMTLVSKSKAKGTLAVRSNSEVFQPVCLCSSKQMAEIHQKEMVQLDRALDMAMDVEECVFIRQCIDQLGRSDGFVENSDAISVDDHSDNTYFYQCSDGQHFYLHSLDFRILMEEFGSIKHVPLIIESKVIGIEMLQQTEETRKKYRFLSHLTLSTVFGFIELDMRQIVSKETMLRFDKELKARQRQKITEQKRLHEEEMKYAEKVSRTTLQQYYATSQLYDVPPNILPDDGFLPDRPVRSKPQNTIWSRITEKGLAASQDWAPLPSSKKDQSKDKR